MIFLLGGTLVYHRSSCPDIIWGNGVSPKKYLAERRFPASPSTTPLGGEEDGSLGEPVAWFKDKVSDEVVGTKLTQS